jgi:4-alpha-glucanotransferase
MHISSLPGPHAVGDLGPVARTWLAALESGQQRFWQVLPVCALGGTASPYSAISAFAGERSFISLQMLAEEGLLNAGEVPPFVEVERSDFERARELKDPALRIAHRRFSRETKRFVGAMEAFREGATYWLEDFCTFEALRRTGHALHGRRGDFETARQLVRQDASLSALSSLVCFEQFLFERQWAALRADANARGVRLIGDLPLFIDGSSVDILAHPELFKLDEHGEPLVVSGVPPDYFAKEGQRWGTPVFDVERMQEEHFNFFVQRFGSMFARFDLTRVDHFIGFHNAWEIPRHSPTAVGGSWQKGPGRAVFDAVSGALNMRRLPLIAEDLGVVSADVAMLRDGLELPGMRVLQFAFGGDTRDPFLPHNYLPNTVAYTGTHDNDTWAGFFLEPSEHDPDVHRHVVARAARYLGLPRYADAAAWVEAATRVLYGSVANTVILPIQDVLAQPRRARMNRPGTIAGNFVYRMPARGAYDAVAALADLAQLYGRAPKAAFPEQE